VTQPVSRGPWAWLAIVRILTGAIWLTHAVPKFTNPGGFLPPSGAFATFLRDGIARTSGPYHDFLVNVVQPNASIFAEAVRVGELLIGISLVLGLFSRVGALFGTLLAIDYIAGRSELAEPGGWGSLAAALALLSALNFVLPTGRVAGADALRGGRVARRRPVVAEVVPERPMQGPTAPR
jgi:uncharacterized membrane protein YphA (DoxX/SURF4 family)